MVMKSKLQKKGNVFSVQYPPNEELESKMQSKNLAEMYPFDNLQPWINACTETDKEPNVNVKFEKWNPTTTCITSLINEDVKIRELVTTIKTFFSDMNNVNFDRNTIDLRF